VAGGFCIQKIVKFFDSQIPLHRVYIRMTMPFGSKGTVVNKTKSYQHIN